MGDKVLVFLGANPDNAVNEIQLRQVVGLMQCSRKVELWIQAASLYLHVATISISDILQQKQNKAEITFQSSPHFYAAQFVK